MAKTVTLFRVTFSNGDWYDLGTMHDADSFGWHGVVTYGLKGFKVQKIRA